jgi:hypothetical protein
MVGRLRKLYGVVWNHMRLLNERSMHPPVSRRGIAPDCMVQPLEPRLLLTGQGFDFPGAQYAVGDDPFSMTAADVDGDGAVDLITANAWSDTVSVLRNLGDGTFGGQVTYAVGSGPMSVTAADVDGDGAVDLITANAWSATVSVLRNLGDGTFGGQVTYTVGSMPNSVTAADVDGDGAVDLITANHWSFTVSVLRNLGDGTFGGQMTYAVGSAPVSVTAADVDGDGAVDLIAANEYSGTVSVLRNLGDGTFGARVTYAVGSGPRSVTAADVDGDGAVDLIMANEYSGTVSVLRNLGDGTFGGQVIYAVGGDPRWVTAADVDGDGAVDLITAIYNSGSVSVLRNLGDGTFGGQMTYAVGSSPLSVTAADVDGDGAVDLIAASGSSSTVSVLLNLGQPGDANSADLVVGEVLVEPGQASVGEPLQVEYRVENHGPGAAIGGWVDSIYLSKDERFDAADQLLGRVIHDGDVAAGGHYSQMVDVTVPSFAGFAPGAWFVLVRTDAAADLAETNDTNNTATASVDLALAVNPLALDVAATGALVAGEEVFFQVEALEGQPLSFVLDNLPPGSTVGMYIKYGGLPSQTVFDRASVKAFASEQYVYLPAARGGTYYVMIRAATVASAPASYRLTASVPAFGVRSTRFGTGGAAGDYTIRVVGAGFDRTITARLTNNAGVDLPAKAHWYASQTEMYATFDLRGVAPGTYDVVFTDSQSAVVTVPASLTVVAASSPSPVVPRVISPSGIRRGREFSFTVEWANDSLNDAIAPLLTVGLTVPFGLGHNDYSLGTRYTFLGTNTQGGPAGILRPGQREILTFWAYSDTQPGDYRVFADPVITDMLEPFDWQALRPSLIPANMTDAEFEPIFQQLVDQVGPTSGDYLAMLSRNASLCPDAIDARMPGVSRQIEVDRAWAAVDLSITGTVTAEAGIDVIGRTIVAENLSTHESFSATILGDTSFLLPGLTPGDYRLTMGEFAVTTTLGAIIPLVAPNSVLELPVIVQQGGMLSFTLINAADMTPVASGSALLF